MAGFKSKKPNIDLSRPAFAMGSNHGRVWKNVNVAELRQGDIVSGMGLVKTTLQTCEEDHYLQIGDKEYFLSPDHMVFAFVKKG